jgi:hypothetical protein
LLVEGDTPFPPHFINVAAEIPPEQVPFQPWAAELFQKRLAGNGGDDPGAYTKPFTYTVKSSLMPEDDLLEYFCAENEKDAQHYQ